MDGRVTVPTIVRRRACRPDPAVTVSPTRLPSARRVAAPSSIWSWPLSGCPLVVGGCTAPWCRVRPSTGMSWWSTASWANANVDQPVTPGWPLTSRSICRTGHEE